MPPRSSPTQDAVRILEWEDDDHVGPEFHTVVVDNIKSSCSLLPQLEATTLPCRKRVTFLENHQVHSIQHLDDYTNDEIAATWYSGAEYADIKASYRSTIYLIECNKSIPEGHTSRGLEYRTQEGAWARYENKRDAYNAVLDEQDAQWNKDVDDQDVISQIYLKHSTKCAKAARDLGHEDAIEARELYAQLLHSRPNEKEAKKKSFWNRSSIRRMLSGPLASN